MIPAWVSWKGLAQHLAIGAAGTVVLVLLHTPPLAVVVAALVVGGTHEQAQRDAQDRTWSDFRRPNPGAPLNGTLDVLAFVAGVPLGYALLALVR